MRAQDGMSKLMREQNMMEEPLPITSTMCRFHGKRLAYRYELVLKTK